MTNISRLAIGKDARITHAPPCGPWGEFPFVWVRPGSFTMQGPPSKPNGELIDGAFQVTITRGYWLGMFPVTQTQWQAIMGAQPSKQIGCLTCPVESVSWQDALALVEKLNTLFCTALPESYRFALPTEAQWEFACRANTASEFYTGDGEEALSEAAWYVGNSGGRCHPVGEKAANAWGFYDLHGNVCEWCQDWADDYPYEAQFDWSGPPDGIAKIIRGGCFNSYCSSGMLCSGGRAHVLPRERVRYIGMRVAISSGETSARCD